MLRPRYWLGLPAFLLLTAPLLAADEKKADDSEPKPAKDKPVVTAKFLAKVLNVDSTKKSLTVQLDQPIVIMNRYQAGRILYWQQEAVKASRDKNPKNRIKRVADCQNHIAYHEARLYERHDKLTSLNAQATDDVTVRTLQLPQVFDDKGNPRKYTTEELKERKGDPKEIGYSADFGDIKAGQVVEITVAKTKSKPPSDNPGPGKSLADKKSNDDKPAPTKPAEAKPLVVRIVIAR